MTHQFSSTDIAQLAEMERRMDAGQIPFVMLPGVGRVSTSHATMQELGLLQGQTINQTIFGAILRMSLAECEAKIAIRNAQRAADNGDSKHD